MIWLALIIIVVLICFTGVLLVGAPYLPTLTPQVKTALELANLKEGQTLLELGCGDGKVLIAAAEQGINVIGIELNPLMALISWLRTRKYRNARIIWGNFWSRSLYDADAIFVFLLPKYMEKLNTKIVQSTGKPVKLVSFAFQIPSKKPAKIKDDIYLYKYLPKK